MVPNITLQPLSCDEAIKYGMNHQTGVDQNIKQLDPKKVATSIDKLKLWNNAGLIRQFFCLTSHPL
jgi:hypothetical protein